MYAPAASRPTACFQRSEGIAGEEAVGARRVERLAGEDADEQRAQNAAHAVDAERVERVVVVELRSLSSTAP